MRYLIDGVKCKRYEKFMSVDFCEKICPFCNRVDKEKKFVDCWSENE